MDNQIADYIREDINRRFDEVNQRIGGIDTKLDDLKSFKLSMVVSARWVSLIVSALCGLLTFAASTWVSYKIQSNEMKIGGNENVGFHRSNSP